MDARARRSEHFSHGIDTDSPSRIRTKPSTVVSIAFARTGCVLLGTISSKTLTPCSNDLIEMLKNDLTHFAPQTRR